MPPTTFYGNQKQPFTKGGGGVGGQRLRLTELDELMYFELRSETWRMMKNGYGG